MTAQLGLNYFGGNLFAQPYISYQIVNTINASLVDGLGLLDQSSGALVLIVALTDGVGVSDSIQDVSQIVRNILDNQGVTDTLTGQKSIVVFITDNVGIADSLSYIGRYTKDVPKLLQSLEFKPMGDFLINKTKTSVVLVSKPQTEV